MSNPKRRRFIDVLRRTATLAREGGRSALDDAALWDARDRASNAALDAVKLAEKVTAGATRQRSQLEAAVERASGLGPRADAASASAKLVADTFERLSIVALNAGLEGARLSDSGGKALLLLSDDLKAQASVGAENTRKLLAASAGLSKDASELSQRLERIAKEWSETSSEAALLKSSAQDASTALVALEARLRKATGLDPDVARNLSEAGDHARGLVRALTALEAQDIGDERGPVSEALVPLVAPLKKLLSALTDGDGDSTNRGDPE